MCLCTCLHASVHVVQDQRQTGMAQKQIQHIVKGGGGEGLQVAYKPHTLGSLGESPRKN